ncbi:hypothetical protein MKZ91_30660, partial [Ensifer sp. MJa1]
MSKLSHIPSGLDDPSLLAIEFALSFDVAGGYVFEDSFQYRFGIARPVAMQPRSMTDMSENWNSAANVDRNDHSSLDPDRGGAGSNAGAASTNTLAARDAGGQASGSDASKSTLRSFDETTSERAPSTARADAATLSSENASTLAAPSIFETRVAASADDAEERSTGSMSLSSSDLELTVDDGVGQAVGIRFIGVDIPKGAIITNAYIQFTVDEVSTGTI